MPEAGLARDAGVQPSWRFMQKTSDINVVETRALPTPGALLTELPKTEVAGGIRHARSP